MSNNYCGSIARVVMNDVIVNDNDEREIGCCETLRV